MLNAMLVTICGDRRHSAFKGVVSRADRVTAVMIPVQPFRQHDCSGGAQTAQHALEHR